MSTYIAPNPKSIPHIDIEAEARTADAIAAQRLSSTVLPDGSVVRLIDGWCCRYCYRTLRPSDIERTLFGWRLVCTGCHRVGFEIEPAR
jgi:hypothetical protein